MNKKTLINLFVANGSHREIILLNNVVMKIIEIQKGLCDKNIKTQKVPTMIEEQMCMCYLVKSETI